MNSTHSVTASAARRLARIERELARFSPGFWDPRIMLGILRPTSVEILISEIGAGK